MNKVRLATIGVGRFGVSHLHAFKQLENTMDVKLVAAAEIDKSKHDLIKNSFGIPVYKDYLDMIANENLDAVSVATQDHLHKEIVINSLLNNLHVLVEKPMTTSYIESNEIIKVASEKELLVQVDFHKRYDPYHIEIKHLTEQGKFGDFLYGYCHMEDQIVVPRDWFKSWVHNSSPVWFLGSHFIDLMMWLMNSRVKSVYAIGHKKKLLGIGLDTYDSVQSMLTFENNAVITFDSSWILPEQFSGIVNQGFRLVGTEGIVEADSHSRGTSSCFSNDRVRNHNSGFMLPVIDFSGKYKYEGYGIKSIQHFAENVLLIKEGKLLKDLQGSYPSGVDGNEVTKTIEAIHLSAGTGEVVTLNGEAEYA